MRLRSKDSDNYYIKQINKDAKIDIGLGYIELYNELFSFRIFFPIFTVYCLKPVEVLNEKLIESNHTANVLPIIDSTENFKDNFYNKIIVGIAVNLFIVRSM